MPLSVPGHPARGLSEAFTSRAKTLDTHRIGADTGSGDDPRLAQWEETKGHIEGWIEETKGIERWSGGLFVREHGEV
jgi:hypothetical protein